jgi:penicillin-binding protein 1A
MPIGMPPSGPNSPQPMVRPDGTGEPTQQELDQAFPPQQRSNQYPQRQPAPESTPPPDAAEPRPQTP